MTPASPNLTSAAPGSDRDDLVEQVVAGTLARRHGGEPVSDADVLAEHPDLLPELARSLRTAAAVREAYLASRRAGVASTADALEILSDDELDAPIADPVADPSDRFRSDRLWDVAPAVDGYEVLSELPRGAQAVVYLARQRSTGRRVAVKVLTEGRSAAPRARRRFKREADVLAALDHPHLVSAIDAGETADGVPFLVMPYVDGLALDEHLADRAAMGGADAMAVLALFEELARAVHAAHEAGVVHRDLKPSNIRVDRNGQPRVLDFGLALLSDPPDGSPTAIAGRSTATLTLARHIVGSPAWMSPEQAVGATDAVDARADVYALGVILYDALARRPPYPIDGPPHAVLGHVLGTTPVGPSRSPSARPGVTRWVDAVVLKCLAKHPADRYRTAAALADDLARCRAGARPWAVGRRDWSDLLGPVRWSVAAAAAVAVLAWEGRELGLLGDGKPVVVLTPGATPPQTPRTPQGVGIQAALIPSGSFLSTDPVTGRTSRVDVPRGFWMGATEVTREQFASVMGWPATPGSASDPPQVPVTNVTRAEAVAFCRRLGRARQRTCRLPTEAEWEWAARCGNGEPAAGDLFGPADGAGPVAWHAGNSGGRPHPVGRLRMSPFRLLDMNGNVAEWCADLVPGPTASGSWGVTRGGSYASPADACRNRSREVVPADRPRPDVGFRVVFEDASRPPEPM